MKKVKSSKVAGALTSDEIAVSSKQIDVNEHMNI